MAMRVLLDTNVVLDLLLAREPFVQDALLLFAMGEAGELDLLLSSDAVSTVFYVVERNKDAMTARRAITSLLGRMRLLPLRESDVLRGLGYDFIDIEDALVASVAEEAKAEVIISRNVKDFANSPVATVTPSEFLAFWQMRLADKPC